MKIGEMQTFPFWAFVQRDRQKTELFYFEQLAFTPNGEKFIYTHHYYLIRPALGARYGWKAQAYRGYLTRANLKSHFRSIDKLSVGDRQLWIKVVFEKKGD